MRKILFNKTLGGLLECESGVTALSGNLITTANEYQVSPFYSDDAPDAPVPFSSNDNIVAERLRISVGNAAGLRKSVTHPFSMGIATLDADAVLKFLVWKDIREIDEWQVIDRDIAFNNTPDKNLYCVFKDLNLRYDVAQIDMYLDQRPISLNIELEISAADSGRR